jgi:hypothetical protein
MLEEYRRQKQLQKQQQPKPAASAASAASATGTRTAQGLRSKIQVGAENRRLFDSSRPPATGLG